MIVPPHYSPFIGGVFDQPNEVELRYNAKDIARRLHRDEKSVLKSLFRLERRGKVEANSDGWRWKE